MRLKQELWSNLWVLAIIYGFKLMLMMKSLVSPLLEDCIEEESQSTSKKAFVSFIIKYENWCGNLMEIYFNVQFASGFSTYYKYKHKPLHSYSPFRCYWFPYHHPYIWYFTALCLHAFWWILLVIRRRRTKLLFCTCHLPMPFHMPLVLLLYQRILFIIIMNVESCSRKVVSCCNICFSLLHFTMLLIFYYIVD